MSPRPTVETARRASSRGRRNNNLGKGGAFLAGPDFDGATILTAELDMDDIARGKYDLDVAGHYARPDIFKLLVNGAPMPAVETVNKPQRISVPQKCRLSDNLPPRGKMRPGSIGPVRANAEPACTPLLFRK